MTEIYANIYGNWTKLDSNYIIDNKPINVWVQNVDATYNGFIKIYNSITKETLGVHISNIIIKTISF